MIWQTAVFTFQQAPLGVSVSAISRPTLLLLFCQWTQEERSETTGLRQMVSGLSLGPSWSVLSLLPVSSQVLVWVVGQSILYERTQSSVVEKARLGLFRW